MSKSGVCTHSTQSAFEDYVIIATAPHKVQSLRDYLRKTDNPHGLGSRELVGSYKGEIETAWIMNVKRLPAIQAAGFLIEQESVLHLLHNPRGARIAWLEFVRSGNKTALGHFVNVPEEQAKREQGWTFCPATHAYYVCTRGDRI